MPNHYPSPQEVWRKHSRSSVMHSSLFLPVNTFRFADFLSDVFPSLSHISSFGAVSSPTLQGNQLFPVRV